MTAARIDAVALRNVSPAENLHALPAGKDASTVVFMHCRWSAPESFGFEWADGTVLLLPIEAAIAAPWFRDLPEPFPDQMPHLAEMWRQDAEEDAAAGASA